MKRMLAGLFFAAILLYNGGARAEAKAYLLMEAETGRVLYESNARTPLPMASTTKVMTALLALEHGNLDEMVTAGPNAFGVPGTSIYLSQGEQLTLREMLYGLMLASGNDAAVAIAEHISGSVPAFCQAMTERARVLGCENTLFSTPHGLPAAHHYTTAYDLALITREAMRNPIFREIVSTQRATIPWTGHDYDRVLNNKNRLLSSYPGATGVKTGYTKAAGRCLVFSAERENMALIGVVLNCPDWFDQAEALLDRGFQNWQMVTLLHQNEAIGQLPVERGQKEFITIRASRDIAAPMETDTWPDLVIDLPASLPAGVEKGQIVGSAHLMDGGKIICTIPLYADEASPEQTFRFQLERILSCW